MSLLWSVSSPDTFLYFPEPSEYIISYREGLGLSFSYCYNFETFDEERLIWYIKDGQQYCVPSPCVGFQEQSNETEVNVFPNPMDATLNVKSHQPIFSVQIFSLQGQLVSYKNLGAAISTELNVSGLLPGIYFAKVIMQDNFTYRRIIKSN